MGSWVGGILGAIIGVFVGAQVQMLADIEGRLYLAFGVLGAIVGAAAGLWIAGRRGKRAGEPA